MPRRAISIDTSVLVERVDKATGDWSAELNDLCDSSAYEWHWDEYTRQQFRNVLLPAAVLAHTLLKESSTVPRAASRCPHHVFNGGDGPGRHAAALLNTLADRFVDVMPDLNASDTRQLVLDQLSAYLDGELRDFGDDLFERRSDAAGCVYADGTVSAVAGIYDFSPSPRCNRDDPRSCTIEAFWKRHDNDMVALSRGAAKEPGPKRIQRAAAQCVATPAAVRGANCTAPLSDAVIYLTSEATGRVATTNVRDFVFIDASTTTTVEVHAVSVRPPTAPARRRP